MKTICTVFLLLLLLSCTSSSEKLAWEIANNSQTNKKELTRFLEHYKTNKDKDKYKAACFLIENMPNKYSINGKEQKVYDIDIVKADSLIKSLEHSFFLKEKGPYLKNYTFEQFCEYILPYRVADESLQYYWKWDCSRKFEKQCTNDIIQTAQNINAQIKIELSPEFYKDTLKSYSSIIKTGYGKCDDRTALVTMALRSVGIPAAFEFVPYWGSNNNGHSFVSIILPDNKIYPLQNTDKQANGDYYLSRKTPKIYRKVYSIQDLAKHVNNIPELFRHNDILDVTKLQILQTAARIVPNSELYIKLGDFWKQKKDFSQAEACYQTAAAMIPHHITPSYKLFQLYIEEGNINAAINMGNYLLKQPIKKKGTKALRMEAEVLEFLHKEKNIKRTQ